MKIVPVLFFCASITFADEYMLHNGSRISGSVIDYKPAVITIQIDSGAKIEFPETAFKWSDLARMLPTNSVYTAYANSKNKIKDAHATADQSIELAERVNNESATLSKNLATAILVIDRYAKADLLPMGFAEEFIAALEGKPFVKYSNKYGVPDGLLDRIRTKAKNKYPNDYDMQLYQIEKEVNAWKKIND